jgi:hypothetical protein
MALTTVAELRSTLGVGTLYPDATLQEVCDATDAVLLPMLWTNSQIVVSHSSIVGEGTLYFNQKLENVFYVGQTVTIAGCGSSFNGSKVLLQQSVKIQSLWLQTMEQLSLSIQSNLSDQLQQQTTQTGQLTWQSSKQL